MVRASELLTCLPDGDDVGGAFGRFCMAVAALLEADAGLAKCRQVLEDESCDRFQRRKPLGAPGRAEAEQAKSRAQKRRVFSLKCQVRDLARKADALEEGVRSALADIAGDLSDGYPPPELPHVAMALELSAGELADLTVAGTFSDNLELEVDVGILRAGWRLWGGLALAGVEPRRRPVPIFRHPAAMEQLAQLAGIVPSAALAFGLPLLDLVSHQLRELAAWHGRFQHEEEEERALDKMRAQERLRCSTLRERNRLLAKRGFDAARAGESLEPAHIERRLRWNEYRAAETLHKMYNRQAEREAARKEKARREALGRWQKEGWHGGRGGRQGAGTAGVSLDSSFGSYSPASSSPDKQSPSYGSYSSHGSYSFGRGPLRVGHSHSDASRSHSDSLEPVSPVHDSYSDSYSAATPAEGSSFSASQSLDAGTPAPADAPPVPVAAAGVVPPVPTAAVAAFADTAPSAHVPPVIAASATPAPPAAPPAPVAHAFTAPAVPTAAGPASGTATAMAGLTPLPPPAPPLPRGGI